MYEHCLLLIFKIPVLKYMAVRWINFEQNNDTTFDRDSSRFAQIVESVQSFLYHPDHDRHRRSNSLDYCVRH